MDWTNPIGAAVSGIANLIGTRLQYKYQSKLAEQQNQYNIDMWKMQNEYNSPAAQMRRFEEAGLNPALMYSQGNPGNATSAPQMVTPDAPDYSKGLQELSQAFNIEGLRTAIANRKKAEADARSAKALADDKESDNEALHQLYWNYHFDPLSGKFVYDGGIESRNGNNIIAKPIYGTIGYMARAKAMNLLSDNFRSNFLLVPRSNLIGSQRSLNNKRIEYLAPQIRYQNFITTPWRMKTNWWIGNVKNGVQAVAPFVTPFL